MCSKRKRGIDRGVRILGLLLALALPVDAFPGPHRDPSRYGEVVIDNYSRKPGLSAVIFDHWLHRARFTCRLCHVDVGFAMEAKGTGITAETNRGGFHCGACHNGRTAFLGEILFPACSDGSVTDGREPCERCHSLGRRVARKREYGKFTADLPGNYFGVDWEAAEAGGFVAPLDFVEGISVRRAPLASREDFAIASRAGWMVDTVFSHRKHAVWNGCEVCHPGIFPSTRKGGVRYTMLQIAGGEYCGVCHGKVAFPIKDCDRCHTGTVRQW